MVPGGAGVTKVRSAFVCSSCGYETARWLGKCPGCGEWNTLTEFVETRGKSHSLQEGSAPVPISSVKSAGEARVSSGSGELDRVLGGGIVRGSLVLIGGDPGIGKSTLLLQVCGHAGDQGKVLYVSGEESMGQIRLRAERLGATQEGLFVLAGTDITQVEEYVSGLSPDLVVVDSIQTMWDPGVLSAPGSVAQVRQCAARLLRLAKDKDVPVFVVGHVTKGGDIAGPRLLEHMVDTVLYFEGERFQSYRVLRAVKNRFGSTNEIGVFEMKQSGLEDVANASGVFLGQRSNKGSGSAVVPCVEGTRPILIEVQALVTPAMFGAPRRTASGLDHNRVCLIAAVLEKRAGLNLASQDAYIKVAGGLEVTEPAVDLAVAVAVCSSLRDRPVREDAVVAGEVGLGGEVREVGRAGLRAAEAVRMGFKVIILPEGDVSSLKERRDLEKRGARIHGVNTAEEAFEAAIQ